MFLAPVFWAVAAITAALYLPQVRAAPSQTRTVLKTVSVAALAAAAFLSGGYVLLVLALALCAVGDAFLAQEGEGALKAGMAAFAAGHLVYIGLFANQGGGIGADPVRILLQIGLAAGGWFALRRLWPQLGAMRAPVAAYACVVVLMALLALGLPGSLWLVTLGALMFLVSDAILAFELFAFAPDAPARRWSGPAVWMLYWGGQALITVGMLYPVR